MVSDLKKKIAKKMNHMGNIDEENEREERNNHVCNDVIEDNCRACWDHLSRCSFLLIILGTLFDHFPS